jgi:hypothetical protein
MAKPLGVVLALANLIEAISCLMPATVRNGAAVLSIPKVVAAASTDFDQSE